MENKMMDGSGELRIWGGRGGGGTKIYREKIWEGRRGGGMNICRERIC